MDSARILSFDLDGALIDISFVNSVWLEGMPRLYALRNGISFEDAKKSVISEYSEVGRRALAKFSLVS